MTKSDDPRWIRIGGVRLEVVPDAVPHSCLSCALRGGVCSSDVMSGPLYHKEVNAGLPSCYAGRYHYEVAQRD